MYDLPLKSLDGSDLDASILRGRASLVVNVASQVRAHPAVHRARGAPRALRATAGFTVLGFPCNQFGGQEPGTAEEIAEFCSTTYGVTFPMTEKVDVNGPRPAPALRAS